MIIKLNLASMFSHREPWDCSNSIANLGPNAAELTWGCALEVARNAREWLLSPLSDTLEAIERWAKATGAWDADEIAAWSDEETLALLVQNVASDLRELGADNEPLEALADDDSEGSTYVYQDRDQILGEWMSE